MKGLIGMSIMAFLARPGLAQDRAALQQKADEWAGSQYEDTVDRLLSLGEWTDEPARAALKWRLAFRARADGAEWRVVVRRMSDSKATEAEVTVAETPIKDQLIKIYLARPTSPPVRVTQVNLLTRNVRVHECAAAGQLIEGLDHAGTKLAEPLEWALDVPVYEVKIETLARAFTLRTQGFGEDQALVKTMRELRGVVEGQCRSQ